MWLDFMKFVLIKQLTFKFGKRIYPQEQITQGKQNLLESKQLEFVSSKAELNFGV